MVGKPVQHQDRITDTDFVDADRRSGAGDHLHSDSLRTRGINARCRRCSRRGARPERDTERIRKRCTPPCLREPMTMRFVPSVLAAWMMASAGVRGPRSPSRACRQPSRRGKDLVELPATVRRRPDRFWRRCAPANPGTTETMPFSAFSGFAVSAARPIASLASPGSSCATRIFMSLLSMRRTARLYRRGSRRIAPGRARTSMRFRNLSAFGEP